ncbi:hypothetical protein H1C71_009224 [Ictidomys tridecemlineatus]|nr:hypothetical protein H1C71_009224 [Ictidomys tridecemlineatus]
MATLGLRSVFQTGKLQKAVPTMMGTLRKCDRALVQCALTTAHTRSKHTGQGDSGLPALVLSWSSEHTKEEGEQRGRETRPTIRTPTRDGLTLKLALKRGGRRFVSKSNADLE